MQRGSNPGAPWQEIDSPSLTLPVVEQVKTVHRTNHSHIISERVTELDSPKAEEEQNDHMLRKYSIITFIIPLIHINTLMEVIRDSLGSV